MPKNKLTKEEEKKYNEMCKKAETLLKLNLSLDEYYKLLTTKK